MVKCMLYVRYHSVRLFAQYCLLNNSKQWYCAIISGWWPAELCAKQGQDQQLKLGCADEQSAKDLLQCLYYLACRVVRYHKAFRDSKVLSLARQTHGSPKTPPKPALSTSEIVLELSRRCLGMPCMLCCALKSSKGLLCQNMWFTTKQWVE